MNAKYKIDGIVGGAENGKEYAEIAFARMLNQPPQAAEQIILRLPMQHAGVELFYASLLDGETFEFDTVSGSTGAGNFAPLDRF